MSCAIQPPVEADAFGELLDAAIGRLVKHSAPRLARHDNPCHLRKKEARPANLSTLSAARRVVNEADATTWGGRCAKKHRRYRDAVPRALPVQGPVEKRGQSPWYQASLHGRGRLAAWPHLMQRVVGGVLGRPIDPLGSDRQADVAMRGLRGHVQVRPFDAHDAATHRLAARRVPADEKGPDSRQSDHQCEYPRQSSPGDDDRALHHNGRNETASSGGLPATLSGARQHRPGNFLLGPMGETIAAKQNAQLTLTIRTRSSNDRHVRVD